MSEAPTWYQLNHGRRPLGMLPLCALAVVWREDDIEAMVRSDVRGDLLYERIDRLTVRKPPGVVDWTEPMKQRSGTMIKVDCCCWLRLVDCNTSAGADARAIS